MSSYSTNEMMTVAAARRLHTARCASSASACRRRPANLARLTSSPDVVLIYESGPIGAKPSVLPLSIGDGELAETADTVVPTGEIFRYWLQGGRIDVGFLGAAQVDRFGNINTTVIGDYRQPKVRLPGAGGAPEIAGSAKEVLIILKQSHRTFVDKLPFCPWAAAVRASRSRSAASSTSLGAGVSATRSAKRIAQPVASTTCSRVTPGCSEVTTNSLLPASGSMMHRSVMIATGPLPGRPRRWRESPPSPWPTEVTKASLSTKVRCDCLRMISTSLALPAISGAPPAPGRRTLGWR